MSEVFGGGVYSVVRHTSSAATDTSAPKTSASASSALWDSPTADSLYGICDPPGVLGCVALLQLQNKTSNINKDKPVLQSPPKSPIDTHNTAASKTKSFID
ncbi:hypothetical protein QJS10_CPB04g01647 [Acorus calamus]|uniref:Uncharacterized protein n=1 Tax=Acorus calamus TaxID=4465 RepID=A0AAV9F306_ACOCL|nr:hypothetical protein QJS10_CPB04g01643 [Acorus calamus]KAK1319462.1 hypothetical protein QJS10_CPB04g01647 [Acorus calamus]